MTSLYVECTKHILCICSFYGVFVLNKKTREMFSLLVMNDTHDAKQGSNW